MENRSVTISGFPSALNVIKLKLFIEKQVESGIVENVTKNNDGSATFLFKDPRDLQQFYRSNVNEYKFGTLTYILRVVNTGKGDPHGATENLHSSSTPHQEQTKIPPAKKVPRTNILDLMTQKNLYENSYYWSSLPVLPADEGSRCVLAQGIDTSTTHIQKVTMHFESKKRSNGGPVFCIIKMIDGLLIVFDDLKDCESCLAKSDQKFDVEEFTIYPKLIPSYFEKIFVLKGVGDQTTMDTLVMYLESCSSNETAPSNCVKTDLPGVYRIEYGNEYDVSETETLLRNIKTKRLEGNSLKATPLLRTDCLKVIEISTDATNDTIRLIFESKKRTDGGLVTRIDRLKDNQALVYFALHTDAERIFKKFKVPCNQPIIINNKPVKVELYHHCLANDHLNILDNFKPTPKKKPEPAPQPGARLGPFELKPNCDEKIIKFITGSQKHDSKLKNAFKYLATVEFRPQQQDQEMVFVFTSNQKQRKEAQNDFNAKCQKNFEDFLVDYTSSSNTFERSKLQKARSYKLFPQIDEKYTGNVDNDDLIVCWKQNEPIVEITGIKSSVDLMIEHIKNCVNSSMTEMSVNNDQFGVMVNCGIVEQLRMNHKNVQIKCDMKQQKIILTGPESALSAFQIDALTRLNTIEKKRLNGLDESVVRYLSESMSGSEVITKQIQNQLRNNNIKAMISLDGEEPCLRVGTINDFKQGINLIKEYIVIETVRTDEPRANVVKSPAWKGFHQNLRSTTACGIYIKSNEAILMVGTRSEVKMLRVEINKFLDKNAIKRLFMQLPYGSARFIMERSPLFTPEACEKREIKCGLSPEGGGGVFANGKMRALDDVHADFKTLRTTILEMTHILNEPGIKDYYQGEEGRKFLEQTGRVNNCIILTMSRECAEWIEYNKKNLFLRPNASNSSPVDFEEQKLISVTLAKSLNVKLRVWKTNIIKHKCDVIVNASNPELALLPGGVSGVIKKLDKDNGNSIQKEMNKLIERNHGNFLAGNAEITSAGNLPACKKIVHAIGPRWNSISDRADPKLLLKACVLRSLKCVGTAGLKSVAIPAISCGVFGGEISVCIPLILDAVVDYFNETPNSSVKQIDFVELSNQAVLDAFVESVKKHQAEGKPSKSSSVFSSQQSNQASNSTLQTPCCTISVVVGDISSQQVDVIVNVTDTQHVNNIANAGAVSKLLGQKAGARVIQQCANLQQPFNAGDVLETDGGSLQCRKLYHALVTNYNQNSQGIIQSVVSDSLQKAEQSGFQSIAFPAIATGGYRHPPNLIAQWMRQEISNFRGNNLKQIFIVLYSGNPAVISAFNAEFNTGLSSSGNPSFTPTASEESKNDGITFRKIDDKTTRYGYLKVSVIKGDITQQDTDVIVNSTNQQFDLSQGMVSTQIMRKGGNLIQNEAWGQSGGDYVVTSGGKLPCKKIIHLVTPNNPKDLQKKILEALIEVKNLGLSSVSLPAFGTGNLHMDCSTVGSIMRASIELFVKSYPNSNYPSSVKVVIFDKKLLKDFKDTILSETAKKGLWSKLLDFGKSLFSYGGSGPAEEVIAYKDNSLPLFLYSTNREDIQEAIKSIDNEIRKITYKQVITDDVIGRLGKWEWFEISAIARNGKIEISDDSDKYIKRLRLDGLTKDVVNAHEAIKDILKEFAAAETCAAFVFWQRKDQAGAWKDFPIRAGHKLEMAYKKRNGDSTNPTLNKVQVSEFDGAKVIQNTIDLSKLDNDPHGSNPPDIRRRIKEKSVSDIPTLWDDMSGKQSLEVVLTPGSQEYQNVLAKFISAGQFHQTIVSIERIQNLSLYKQYVAKKAEVTEKHGTNLAKPIEQQLFHGTSTDEQIMLHGFDRSYAGRNATKYGRGVYFATTANFSHGYAAPNTSGHRRMFIADVITGDFCQGNQNILAPPQRQSNIKNDLYDSVVDNVMNPSIFVIFKDASAYPTYRITYA
uniref:protein mono-ADP-ribosyltransferase PARP14-like n=1 Tax=Styela clava TaxID=7725 RepID=UPI001939EDA7|nr:protein mono-ADP-ribosyltransferase PARP14-like [Styela clava]